MSTEHHHRILGSYFVLRTSGPVGAHVLRVLAPFAVAPDPAERREPAVTGLPPIYTLVEPRAPGARYETYRDGERLHTSVDPGRAVGHLLWHLHHEAIRATGHFLLVHAGAVQTPAGDVLVLPAAMESGKSTLTAGLVRRGFAYLSDEAAAIDPVGGAVHPFPKAITLDHGSWALFPELDGPGRRCLGMASWHVHPEELGGRRGTSGPARYVVAPSYRPGAATQLGSLSAAAGTAMLAEHAMNLRLYGARALPLVAAVAGGASCHRLTFGDLDEAVDAIVELTSPAG